MSKQTTNETTYLFATIGARTERGGQVTRVSSAATFDDLGIASVGDIVTYDDGTEAVIVDGAGLAATLDDKPIALVGSRLSNGDCIVKAAQTAFGIAVRDGDEIPGLFDPEYLQSSADASSAGGNHA
ncbi:PAAR domain-containing protein [Burkholderia contaminans]|uniref:PAAR domain-containing protein n=1 Tax=Burkholderia contaminans TaxID=488447 RepID=A0A3N8PM34_9BURK|nr:PAAR domain-containing protein [Burkholderia contaminans]RQT12190.1 hypothetical protein DF051_23495 [Burkholderia contaminans]